MSERFIESDAYLIIQDGETYIECRCAVCATFDHAGMDAMPDPPTEDGEYRLRLHVIKYAGVPAISSDEWDVFIEVVEGDSR